MYCTGLRQLNDCYNMLLPKVSKISVHYNTSLRKNYVAYSHVTVVCVIG